MVKVELQQALHGYEGGHRLISSSLPLEGSSRRLVDSLSDASGTNLEGSPELFPYLTGYPLPDGTHYTLAKTWLAKEASRPGAVWTHSLFIPFVNLARLPSLTPLLQVFREPLGLFERSGYEKTLRVTIPDLQQPIDVQEDAVRALLWTLYAKPDDTIVLTGENSSTLPFVFTTLWSQQWPRLRRHFTFCTGVLELRRLGERPFDLQAVWGRGAGTLARPHVTRVEWPYTVRDAAWVDTLVQDLVSSDDDLRRFLSQFGAELSGGRRAMRTLVELYNELRTLQQGPAALRRLAERLAAESAVAEGVRLKQALLTNRAHGGLLPDAYECTALTLIGTWNKAERLDGLTLRLAERVRALTEHKPVLAARLTRALLRRGNRYGSAMLEPLLTTLTTEGLQLTLWRNPELLIKAVAVRPELAYHKEVWQQPQRVQETALQQVADREDATWWLPVVRAMLAAGSSFAAKQLSEHFGGALQQEVLDWYAKEERLPEAWLQQVAKGSVIAPWLEARQHDDLVGIQRVLLLSRPDQKPFSHLPASLWLELAERGQGRREFAPLMTFILCVGFRNTDGRRDALFLSALKDVFRALDEKALNVKAWTWLSDVLSPRPLFYLGPYPPDLALSRAVVRSLADHSFSAASFLSKLDQPERARLLEVASVDIRARHWLEGI